MSKLVEGNGDDLMKEAIQRMVQHHSGFNEVQVAKRLSCCFGVNGFDFLRDKEWSHSSNEKTYCPLSVRCPIASYIE